MSAPDALTTPRFTGRRRSMADFADLRLLHADPRVMATLAADGQPLPEAATRQSLAAGAAHWERHGFGAWHFHDRATGAFAGYCGLRHVTIDDRDEIELLYAVRADRWGTGVASELAAAVLAIAFTDLALPTVVAFTLPTNRASRRVMEKQGFQYERDIVHAGLPHVFYRLTAARWREIGASPIR
jgi:[ribosomal protein S5]-alanine N-acetyltransferase